MSADDEILLETARFKVVRQQLTSASGVRYTKETIQHPGAVVILPLLADARVVLLRNFRPAVGQTLIELPAGTCEPPEPPAATARRELAEETGYMAGRWEKLLEFQMSPGILNERMHLYIAADLTPGEPHRELGEEMEVFDLPLTDALAMCDDGRITDAKTLVALYHYARRRG